MRGKLLDVQQRLHHLSYSCGDLEEKAAAISHAGCRGEIFGPHNEVMDTVQRLLDVSRSERGLPPASGVFRPEVETGADSGGASPEDTDGQAALSSQASVVLPLRVEQPRTLSRTSSAVSCSRPGLRLEDLGGLREHARPAMLEASPQEPSPLPAAGQQPARQAPRFAPVRLLARPLPSVPAPGATAPAGAPADGPTAPPRQQPAASPTRIMGTQILFKPYAEHGVPALPAGSLYAMASCQAQAEGGLASARVQLSGQELLSGRI